MALKRTKYLIVAVAILTVLAIVGWILRNELIRRISNPILADYDIELIDISLDALATEDASIGYLELVHAKGTTIVIEDLTLPVGTASDGWQTYSARRVTVVTKTRDDGAPFELARLIDQVISLKDNFAGTEVHVSEFKLAPYPDIRGIHWRVSDNEQRIGATIESIGLSASVTGIDAASHKVGLALTGTMNASGETNAVNGILKQAEHGIAINGESSLDLPAWQALLKLAGVLPAEVEIRSGTAELTFGVDIPSDVLQTPLLEATLVPSSIWQIGYINDAGASTDVVLNESAAFGIESTFPSVDWSVRQADASLYVTNGEWNRIPVFVRDLRCELGPACSMTADILWNHADMPIGRASQVTFSSRLDIAFHAAGVRVDVQPSAHLELSELEASGNNAKRIEAQLVSTASMHYQGDGWNLSAESIDAQIESFSPAEDIAITAPVYLEKIEASEQNLIVSVSVGLFVPAMQTAIGDRNVAFPGVRGEATLRHADLALDLVTVGLFEDGTIFGHHNLDDSDGAVAIANTVITFDDSSLSKRVAPWSFDFDIGAGKLAVDLQADWNTSGTTSRVDARSTIGIDAMAGYYEDIAFVGLSSDLIVNYGATGLKLEPTTITVDLVDMGISLEEIAADVALDLEEQSFDVENLRMMAFSGVVSADPFSFHTGRDVNNVTLTAKHIELTQLLSIEEFAAVSVTGTIGAYLPITIEQDGVSISAGTLTGEPPGGVIRYQNGGEADDTDTSSVGLVTTALSNFEYESLNSDVTYNKEGDLKLQMQLRGRNPELDDSRPVVLNLGVENNVPQMLKSLQAARAVEEILENRLAR